MSYAERGHRTLPHALDYQVANNPNRLYATIAVDDEDVRKGFRDVTMQRFGHAVDSLAHWIADTIGPSNTFETLSYIGLNDLRYPIFLIAAIKCGYKTLLISPRNASWQNRSLLEQMECRRIFYAPEMYEVAKGLDGIEITPVAPWETWSQSFTEPYPFTKTFDECKQDPIFVLHSSGSTGNPKPIVHTHAFWAAQDIALPSLPDREYTLIRKLLTADSATYMGICPFSHMAGLLSSTIIPLFSRDTTYFIHPCKQPCNVDVVKQMIKTRKVDHLFAVPLMLETFVQDHEFLNIVKQAGIELSYSGGPLTPAVGNFLTAEGIKVVSFWGQTEFGIAPSLVPKDPKNWAWLEFHPCMKLDFELAADGHYELVLNRNPDTEKYLSAWTVVKPETNQIRSKDLFTPHPTEPGLWQFYARTDDVIVLTSGRKFFPLLSEGRIMAHPKVRGAIMVGNNRPYPVALIEEAGDDDDGGLTMDELWPTIEDANSRTGECGRLSRSNVAILPVGSLVRAAKGTIIRQKSIDANSEIIEALYAGKGLK